MAFHCSTTAQWDIHDPAIYDEFQPGFDELIELLDRGYPAILLRLGRPLALPLRVVVERGECCGAFTTPEGTGYSDGDFKDGAALAWTRGVLLGTVARAVVTRVSGQWPADWWADSGPFNGLVVVDVLRELAGAQVASAWEAQEQYPSSLVYQAFNRILEQDGWPAFARFFALVVDDGLDWSAIGGNPSGLRTNYVLGYLSIGAGRNLGLEFQQAQVAGVDPAVVQAVIDARAKLRAADQAGADTTARWHAFRAGDHALATQGL